MTDQYINAMSSSCIDANPALYLIWQERWVESRYGE